MRPTLNNSAGPLALMQVRDQYHFDVVVLVRVACGIICPME